MNNVVLGIDIGGTNTVFGLVDEKGEFYLKNKIHTNSENGIECLIDQIHTFVINTKPKKMKIVGVGVGAPNANHFTGYIENAPNLKWGKVDLQGQLLRKFKVAVSITNDANAAAIGEMIFGAAKNFRNFIEITLGTGLGSGIVIDGKIVYGSDGNAGELGHVIVEKKGRQCGCGRSGCLETIVSATGVVRTAREILTKSRVKSELHDVKIEEITSKMIYQVALKGDKLAVYIFDYTAKILGQSLANIVAITSPEAIVLFGGLANAGDLLLKPVKNYMEESLLSFYKNKVQIILSGLPESDAAILGASALIWGKQ